MLADGQNESSLDLLRKQRSHVLVVLSNPRVEHESAFLEWYQGAYRQTVLQGVGVLTGQHYERHEFDISFGSFPPLPFRYLGIYELSIDGAQAAEGLIDDINALHRDHVAAQASATWLYYPLGEKVGRSPVILPSMMTLVCANAIEGRAAEFREWYATRHIRHALLITAFVSGQCFERTQFQKPGAMDADFEMIATYEQVGTPQSIVDSAASLPKGALRFPSMHDARFIKWVYQPLPSFVIDEGASK